MPSLVDYDVLRLEQEFTSATHNPIHAARILRQFYKQSGRLEPGSVPVSRELRRHLEERFMLRRSRITRKVAAGDGTL